jgi:VanZ family protein
MQSVFRERPDPVELRKRMSGWRGKVWVWWPVVVMVIIIAFESTATFSSANTKGWIRPWLERYFGHINDTVWEVGHRVARKSGHFTGYALLGLAWLRAWLLILALWPGLTWWRWRAVGLAIFGTFCVASLDEWHQTFLPSRTGLFSDVVLDTTGGATMCALVWLIHWTTQKKRDR